MAKFARYEMNEDGHSKFWEITSIDAGHVKAEWGKIGKPAQGNKIYTMDEISKLIKEKFKKGYKLVDSH